MHALHSHHNMVETGAPPIYPFQPCTDHYILYILHDDMMKQATLTVNMTVHARAGMHGTYIAQHTCVSLGTCHSDLDNAHVLHVRM